MIQSFTIDNPEHRTYCMTNSYTIPRTLANKLLTLAQDEPDAEICGLIARSDDNQYHLYSISNVAEENGHLFEMHPQQQIEAFKTMRERQQSLFAIFHSHPHSAAIPSARDLKESAYNEALNIIISLSTKGVLDMRAYRYHDQQVEPVELLVD